MHFQLATDLSEVTFSYRMSLSCSLRGFISSCSVVRYDSPYITAVVKDFQVDSRSFVARVVAYSIFELGAKTEVQ